MYVCHLIITAAKHSLKVPVLFYFWLRMTTKEQNILRPSQILINSSFCFLLSLTLKKTYSKTKKQNWMANMYITHHKACSSVLFICAHWIVRFNEKKETLIIYDIRIYRKKKLKKHAPEKESKTIRNERANNAITLFSNVFLSFHLLQLCERSVSFTAKWIKKSIQVILIELLFGRIFHVGISFLNVTSLSLL